MSMFRKKPVVIKAITFDELVEHGKQATTNIVNGMPWSFSYNGHPVTHENDECYLIPTLEGTHNMTPADMLITGVQGEIYPCKKDIFAVTYEPVLSAAQPADDKKMTKAPCGCDLEKGIVCQACENTANSVIAEASEYLNDFITKRFPSGLEGDIRRIISECVLDAFYDGARWAEAQPQGEPSLILDSNAPAAQNRTIILSR